MFGKLASNTPAAATLTTVYTVPAKVRMAEIDIDIVNTNASAVTIDLAFSTSGTPNAVDYVEKNATISANSGHLLRTGDKLSAGEMVVFKASATGVNIRVSGKELTTV